MRLRASAKGGGARRSYVYYTCPAGGSGYAEKMEKPDEKRVALPLYMGLDFSTQQVSNCTTHTI